MKQITFIILSTLFLQFNLAAQCDGEKYETALLKELEKGAERKAFITLDGSESKTIEHKIELDKDVRYQIYLRSADGGTKGLFVTIYDEKGNKKACTLFNDRFYENVTYYCRATGIYRFVFEFQGSNYDCGAALLAYIGTENDKAKKRKKKKN